MENSQKEKLLKKIIASESLPSPSPLAIRLMDLATDERSSARDLAAVIEMDPGLTARLLRLVSSAFFALPRRISSVSQAVVLLGFRKVRVMALTLSLRDTFPVGKKESMDYDHFWKTSLYRALIAQGFARSTQIGDSNPEEAFILGLISEIGILLLCEAYSGEMKKSFPGGNLSLEKIIFWEEKHIGINHREVGSLTLRRWHFPDNLADNQMCFGSVALESDKPAPYKIVELARRATETMFGQAADLHEVQQLAKSFLNLGQDQVNEILSETFDRIEDIAEQLRIGVNSQTDILIIMEKANRTLAQINASMETSLQQLLDHLQDHDHPQIHEETVQDRRQIIQDTLDAVVHEIRNPLLAIGGFAKRLAQQAKEEERGRQYAKIIAKESTRLEHILEDIMNYCRVYEPVFVERDLNQIINRILNEFSGLCHRDNIDVIRSLPQEPVKVLVDVKGIISVLWQLLKNSTHMIGQTAGTVNVSIQPSQQTGQAIISISDNGRPMPDDIRNALLDSILSTKTFDEDLGLSMVKKIIEAHNGHIEIKTEEGTGNTVILYLPISQSFSISSTQ